MKTRAVRLYLGKIALKGIKMPRTSYRFATYQNHNGKIRHRRIENGILRYQRNSSPAQNKVGMKFKKRDVMTRTLNTTDIKTLNDLQASHDRPIAYKFTKFYINAIKEAVSYAAKNLMALCNRQASTLQPSGQQKQVSAEESPLKDSGSSKPYRQPGESR